MTASPPCEDQTAVFAFLADPRTHALEEPVIRIDTHGAAVFLAGPEVYKIKKAIRFPYMDFSTLEKRRAACEAEIAVNRDNAPDLYVGAIPITKSQDGFRLNGQGQPIEWAVHLRRFDENATLDHLVRQEELGRSRVERLASAIAKAHRNAPVRDGGRATDDLRRVLDDTVAELQTRPDLFASDAVSAFGTKLARRYETSAPLLRKRGQDGQVRRCHGDLHLGNIVLVDDRPVLFDAIEFDEAVATCDVFYDLAFLLMDLWERGLRADANLLLNRYAAHSDNAERDVAALALLPLFLSLRAAIRAKVLAATAPPSSAGRSGSPPAYFQAARQFLRRSPPVLVAVGGMSGSGKSTLAAALAPYLGVAPGAVHLRSDIERKRLFAVEDTVRLGADAYRQQISDDVYERLRALAALGLDAGQSVVVDAVHLSPQERSAVEEVAAKAGVPFAGFWLHGHVDLLSRRVADRRGDASDATAAVVEAQSEIEVGPLNWTCLDAARPSLQLVAEAIAQVHVAQGKGRTQGTRTAAP